MDRLANIWQSWLLLFMIIFVTSSCSSEDGNQAISSEATEKEVTVRIAVPAAQATKSLGNTQEQAIQTIDVLAFRVADDGKEYYDYCAKVRPAATNAGAAAVQSYIVTVLEKDYLQRLVVITNTGSKIKDLVDSAPLKGMEKDDMLGGLEFSITSGNKWDTSANYTPLPMWGESQTVRINSSFTALESPVFLLRMVAKINVQLDKSVQGLANRFKLKSVRVYNTNANGAIVPDPNVITKGTDNKPFVTGATLAATPRSWAGPLVYDNDFSEENISMLNTIYTFETMPPTDKNRSKATGLVIGGWYENDTRETYYRVDFLNNDKSFRSILRNYQYLVNIIDVNGPGHNTPEEAWEGIGVNMDVEILDWNDSGMNDIVFDGQNYLSVDKNNILFSKDASTEGSAGILNVITDYVRNTANSSGWKVMSIESVEPATGDPGWLTITDPFGRQDLEARGDANIKAECRLTCQENNTASDRSVRITFAAGRLRYPVIITQNTRQRPVITFYHADANYLEGGRIENNEILIYRNEMFSETYRFIVKWTPAGSGLIAYEAPVANIPHLNVSINSPDGSLQYILANSRNGMMGYTLLVTGNQDVGNATSIVFIVSNGEQTYEERLIVRYVEPDTP
ncbi:BACON domain-containing protein [Dysgonomonas sp. GY75]|uniref:BACON domain-containing protein n=1 Tax=Dysgonomonas sp. GY75 TaxID=2780419 RepID=UPI0018839BEA|nr:BACON domain-containing protein [Dysgonomonas sp. GY75]MBF0647212.1 BACON domain-containing protein [Dysgonomonas sp. GY75]